MYILCKVNMSYHGLFQDAVDSHGNQVTAGSAHFGTTRPPYFAALDGLMQKTTQKPNSLADVLHNIFGK